MGRPAVSVTSAVEGLAVAKPSLINAIVGVSIAFLVALFAIQQFGTQKLSFVFAPSTSSILLQSLQLIESVTAIWLALLGATG